MSEAPLITVVMPLLNAAHHLGGSMQSPIMQQWRDFEVVLVDGGSRDGSTDLAGQLLSAAGIRHRIALLTDSGIDEAMNHGVALAEGTWIDVMGADHRFLWSLRCFSWRTP